MADALLPALVAAFVANTLAWAWVAVGWRRMADGLADRGLADDGVVEDSPAAPSPEKDAGAPAQDAPSLPAAPVLMSVVVAARDEAARLPVLLRALRQQTHRDAAGRALFEIVVVDDRSSDATAALVERTAAGWTATTDPPLRLV
ncbi:MAG TPA: glycosyltransferase, partial [Rubricoccaceae bacterium]